MAKSDFVAMHPYAPRPIEPLGLRQHDGWTLKEYSVTFGPGALARSDFEPAFEQLLAALPRPAVAPDRPGLGFLIAHRGRGVDYAVLGWWDRENELPLRIIVREPGGPWRGARGSESVCVWDLQVLAFERDAYVDTLLRPGGGGAAAWRGRVLQVADEPAR